MSGWPVVIEDVDRDTIMVDIYQRGVSVEIDNFVVVLTPAQSATLRAALEAAEKEMS